MNDIHTGDTVSVSFIGVVSELDDHGMVAMVTLEGEPRDAYIPRSAALEVLERADGPSRDRVGALRRQPEGGSEDGNGSALGVIAIRWATERQTDTPWAYMRWDGPQMLSNESVVDWVPAGSVPGSSAAEVAVTGEDIDRWAEEDAATQGPEMWTGNGSEEPPHSVRKVADAAGDCLKRAGDDWVGDGGNGYAAKVKPWVEHILPKYAPYAEVSS